MFKRGLLILVLLVAGFAGVVATRPDSYTVSRSTVIAAPPSIVYAQIADFAAWQAWSPWGKLDPSMKTTFSGPAGQVGSSYAWQGNDKVGEGRMTILKAEAPSQVDVQLEFIKPWAGISDTTFALTPSGQSTMVVWTMTGKNNFMGKAFSMFMNMDKMIGGDFEHGLAKLKEVSEHAKLVAAAPAPAASPAPSMILLSPKF